MSQLLLFENQAEAGPLAGMPREPMPLTFSEIPWEDEICADRERRREYRIIEARIELELCLARSWAVQIREAWKNRQLCPIIPEPRYKHVLDMAMTIANT
jgi:hypothetical protein